MPAPVRSEAFYGRVVVLLVVVAVASVAIVAWAIGRFFALNRTAVTPREVLIGSWEVLVSGERPPLNLVLLALLGIALIAFTALSFEIIAALMTIGPRRRYLETLRSAGMPRSSQHRPFEFREWLLTQDLATIRGTQTARG